MEKKIKTIAEDNSGVNVAQATKTGYAFCPIGGIFDMSYVSSKLRRGRVQGGGHVCPTMTRVLDMFWIVGTINETEKTDRMGKKYKVKNVRMRRLTERECMRLMGVADSDIDKLSESGLSRSQIYKMAGNSIVVDVLYNIFRTMFVERNSEPGQASALF